MLFILVATSRFVCPCLLVGDCCHPSVSVALLLRLPMPLLLFAQLFCLILRSQYIVPQSFSSTIRNWNNILKPRSRRLLTFTRYHFHLNHDHHIHHVRLYHSVAKFVWWIHCGCLDCSLMLMRHFAMQDY